MQAPTHHIAALGLALALSMTHRHGGMEIRWCIMVGERSRFKPTSPPKHKAGLGRISPAETDSEVIGSGTPRARSRNLKLRRGIKLQQLRFPPSLGLGVSGQSLVLIVKDLRRESESMLVLSAPTRTSVWNADVNRDIVYKTSTKTKQGQLVAEPLIAKLGYPLVRSIALLRIALRDRLF